MIPPRFEYHAPVSLDEAVGLLERYGGDAKVLAGGQSLIPLLKLRLSEPRALVDINRIPNLAYIREDNEFLRIGAVTRANELLDSLMIRERYPILTEAADGIADPVVRNMGTVGGNVSHGDPANDLPACMLALGAWFAAHGPRGVRTISAGDFYQSPFVTALESNEILTEIRIPKARTRQGSAYSKLEKRVGDFPIVGVAANLVLSAKGAIETAGIGLTAVAPTARLAKEAADSLHGREPTEEVIRHAASLAMNAAEPTSDLRGPADYKRSMVGVLARRALILAVKRARGGG